MKPIRFFLIALCFLVLTGCTAGPRPSPGAYASLAQLSSQPGLPFIDENFVLAPNDVLGITYYASGSPSERYTLQIGDTLLVEYHQQEHLNRNIVIRPDGKVTLPFIGNMKAASLSMEEFTWRVNSQYSKQNIFSNVTVTISLLSFNTPLRELKATINNSMSGQTKEVLITNSGHLDLPLGIRIMAAGKALPALNDEISEAYANILPGVEILSELKRMGSNYIFVLGEVNAPGMIGIGGPMGVIQAVAAAGGFRPTADLSSVVVLRSGKDNTPTGRIVSVDDILSTGNLSQDVLIRRFDVVYVPPSTIKKLNDAVLLYIRNMMPLDSHVNFGFSYMWGDTTSSTFEPF